MRSREWLCLLGFACAVHSVQADDFLFVGQKDSEWTNVANWKNNTNPQLPGVPGVADQAIIRGGSVVRITSGVTVGFFRSGTDGSSNKATQVIIDGGTLTSVGRKEHNSVSYNRPATLIVQNGGSAVFDSRLLVGRLDFRGATVIIHKGTVRVADVYFHNENYHEAAPIDTRTTIHSGGLLDVDGLVLNAGVVDLAGGTLVVRSDVTYQTKEWVNAGRMVAMSGAEGWTVRATFDPVTGWTTVVAVPPATVG